MKKVNLESYRDGLKPAEKVEQVEQTAEKEPEPQQRKEGQNIQNREELLSTLTGETQALLSMRKGRPRKGKGSLPAWETFERNSTFVRTIYIMKLREIAMRANVTLKAVVDEALRNAIEAYERKNGEVVLKPAKRSGVRGIFTE